jgi:hypothetical protein
VVHLQMSRVGILPRREIVELGEEADLVAQGPLPLFLANELMLAHLVPPAILALAGIFGGWNGVITIFLAGLIGRLFHELINCVQHYGLVRVENSPIRPHHSWD